MKKWNMYYGILLALAGLSIIIFPSFWVKVVVMVLGLASILYGIYGLKYSKKIFENTVYERTILIKSIASIVIGVLAILFPLALGNAAWNAVIWVLIIYLILAAVMGFYAAALLKDSGVDRKRYFFENLILVAIAVLLILITPKALGTAILRIIGIVALVIGAALTVYNILSKKKEIVVEAEVTDAPAEAAETESPEETR